MKKNLNSRFLRLRCWNDSGMKSRDIKAGHMIIEKPDFFAYIIRIEKKVFLNHWKLDIKPHSSRDIYPDEMTGIYLYRNMIIYQSHCEYWKQ